MSHRSTSDWTRWPLWRPSGFRISWIDMVVISASSWGTIALWQLTAGRILVLPVVIGHFFLFCNVFRVCRRYELIWTAWFLIVAGVWLGAHSANPWWLLGPVLPVTVALIVAEIVSARYHGIATQWIKPEWRQRER